MMRCAFDLTFSINSSHRGGICLGWNRSTLIVVLSNLNDLNRVQVVDALEGYRVKMKETKKVNTV